jgi:hypothetical protein
MPTAKRGSCGRGVALLLLGLPLLATGPCLITAEQSLVNGFFDAVTPLLIQWYSDQLGVTSTTAFTPTADGTTGFPTSAG